MARTDADLAAMSKNQRRFLARRQCGLCEMPLDRSCCSSLVFVYGGRGCSAEQRAARRRNALETYKPRNQGATPNA